MMRSGMIFFCTALASVAFWPSLPSPIILLPLVLFLLLSSRQRFGLLWGASLLGLIWGLIYAYWGMTHRLPVERSGQLFEVQGVVVGLPRREGAICRFMLQPEHIRPLGALGAEPDNDKKGMPTLRKLRLNWYQCDRELEPGHRWQLVVKLKRPRGLSNPGGFDYEGWLFRQGVDATGYVRNKGLNRRLGQMDWQGRIDHWRWTQSRRLQNGSGESGALVAALVLGDKRGISDQQWELLRRTGTVHLMVISGLHIGLVGGFCYALTTLLGRPLLGRWLFRDRRLGRWRLFRLQPLAAWTAIMGAGGYALLAGLSLPTQRAWVMLSVLMLGVIYLRRFSPWDRLLLALLVVLMLDPLAVRQVGFWLSFGAVCVLFYCFWGRVGEMQRWRAALMAQAGIFVGLLPLLGYFFQQVSVIAPLANLLAIPVIALVLLPLSLLTLVMLSCFSAVGELLLALTVKGFDLLMACLAGLELGLPTVWEQAGFGLPVLLLSLFGAVLLLMPRGLPGRSLAGIMLLPLLLPLKSEWNQGAFRTTVLDVGQGLSVLIETNSHRLLYDTGARYRSGMDAARLAVLPFFYFQGIRSLDRLIVSHGDNDHAGGVDSVLQNIAVGQIQTGSLKLRKRYPQMANCKPGSRWQWDGVTFSWLHSGEDSGNNENNRSCVLKVDNGEYSVLLTGDIEANREKQLVLKHAGQLKADLLVASHHGSGNASSELFIRQVDPVHVVYSASYQNRYGHPHPRVVERFKRAGVLQWNTAQVGMLSVQAEWGREPIYDRYRDTRWAYWLD